MKISATRLAVLALGLSGLQLCATVAVDVFAAWDKTKPADSSPLDAGEIRDNWAALEKDTSANQALNSAVALWDAGTTSAPNSFTLAGTGAAIVRTGTGEADTTRKVGKFAAKITYGSATATLCQDVYSTTTFDTGLQSRSVSLGWWAKTSTASQVRIQIDDGVGQTNSGYHAGDGNWAWLSATRTLDAAATKVTVCYRVEAAGSAYASALTAEWGELPPDDWRPPTLIYNLNTGESTADNLVATTLVAGTLKANAAPTYKPGAVATYDATVSGRTFSDFTQRANVGTSDLTSTSLAAATLNADGKAVRITAWGRWAANANSKRAWLEFGATAVADTTTSTSWNGGSWRLEALVMRSGATAQKAIGLWGQAVNGSTSGNHATFESKPAETLSGAITIRTRGSGSNNDVLQEGFMIEVVG